MTTANAPNNVRGRSRPVLSRIGLLLLIGLCVLFVSSYTSRLLRKAEVEAEITDWEQRIADAEIHQLELQAELEYVKSPAYIEGVARNYLDMAKPGDTVIIVVDKAPSPTADDALVGAEVDLVDSAPAPSERPTWMQWVTILVGEE